MPHDGFMINGKIEVSVASNDLTVAIKTQAGNDPTTADPVYVMINGTLRSITSALSKTLSAGTNYFNAGASLLATLAINYFVYLIWNTTDSAVSIGFSRMPWIKTYDTTTPIVSATSTNEQYLAYSGSAPTEGDDCENIGRFTATLSAGAGYTWSISGTGDVFNKPIYETDWLDYDPTAGAGGGSSMTFTSVTGTGSYKLSGQTPNAKRLDFTGNINGTTGGTASDFFYSTLPFDSEQGSARNYKIDTFVRDATSGNNIGGYAFLVNGTPDIIRFYKYTGTNYGLGAGRQAFFAGFCIAD